MKDDAMCRWAACLITALLAGLCPLTAAQDASPGATSIESSAEKALWLSQLDLSKAQQECWPAQPDRAITGEALSIAGQKFEKGVGSHANSTLRVRLHGSGKRFAAWVGVDDFRLPPPATPPSQTTRGDGSKIYYLKGQTPQNDRFLGVGDAPTTIGNGTVRFKVVGDGKELWSSGVLSKGQPAQRVDVDLRGVDTLELVVDDAGDGIRGDYADWADARLTFTGQPPVAIGEAGQGATTHGASLDVRRAIEALPLTQDEPAQRAKGDWLVHAPEAKASVYRRAHPDEIELANGLIRRVFRLAPNAATVGFDNLMTGETVIRGVKPEAIVEIDGKRYSVGGLLGQPDYAFLNPAWLGQMTSDPEGFEFVGFEVGATRARFPWKRVRHAPDAPWPPPGAALTLHFLQPNVPKASAVAVSVHYELYDGIPLLCKWFTIRNSSERNIRLSSFVSEILAVVEPEQDIMLQPPSPNGEHDAQMPEKSVSLPAQRNTFRWPNLHVETDFAFFGSSEKSANEGAHWVPDKQYKTQATGYSQFYAPIQLECKPSLGPDADIPPGESFESFRSWILIHDSYDRERKGLAMRRMYRTVAPWVTENPIMMHNMGSDPPSVRNAIDQCAEVGFEMVIMTFGSRFKIDSTDPKYIQQFKDLVGYGRQKGVELGGYTLTASRGAKDEDAVILPRTGKPGGRYGVSPCLAHRWGDNYYASIRNFIEQTGLSMVEDDGSYPGDVCASTHHTGHHGLGDSKWNQWKQITDFYKWCRATGVYLNVPDWYYMSGSNKMYMGYYDGTWAVPKERRAVLHRINVYEGTWEKTPSMGWMLVPLVSHMRSDALDSPLSANLKTYELYLAQYLGAGVQACWRGPRLYDTEETKALVKKWVGFYKQYRLILESDVIHVRRPDYQDVDCILHVNPQLAPKGLAMVFNPLDRPVKRTLQLPLYYTGLKETARIREQEGPSAEYQLDRQYGVKLPIDMPAQSVTWFVIEQSRLAHRGH